MRKIFIGCALGLVALLTGILAFNQYIYNEKQAEYMVGDTVTVQGEVLAVDREQMMVDGPLVFTLTHGEERYETIAVPSSGVRLCASPDNIEAAFAIEVGDEVSVRGAREADGSIVPCAEPDHEVSLITAAEVTPRTNLTGVLVDDVSGMQMRYSDRGEDFYIVTLPEALSSTVVFSAQLYNFKDYEMFAAGGAQEPPPSITVLTYEAAEVTNLMDWVSGENYTTRVPIQGAVEPIQIGNREFVYFREDGLYAASVYVIKQGTYIHVLKAEFNTDTDTTLSDAVRMLETMNWPTE